MKIVVIGGSGLIGTKLVNNLRMVPAIKAREENIPLPEFTGTLTERGDACLNALAQGRITSSETANLLSALASQAKLTEVDELERRIAALENTHGKS